MSSKFTEEELDNRSTEAHRLMAVGSLCYIGVLILISILGHGRHLIGRDGWDALFVAIFSMAGTAAFYKSHHLISGNIAAVLDQISEDPAHMRPRADECWSDGDIIIADGIRDPYAINAYGMAEIRWGKLLLWQPTLDGKISWVCPSLNPQAFRRVTPAEYDQIITWLADKAPDVRFNADGVSELDALFVRTILAQALTEHVEYLREREAEEYPTQEDPTLWGPAAQAE
ncbi:hypothetical protein HGA91_04025 [candidate division WWE3 bacterium]|nr:hypothetical protein [candidate division WWE3 bacterium]